MLEEMGLQYEGRHREVARPSGGRSGLDSQLTEND